MSLILRIIPIKWFFRSLLTSEIQGGPDIVHPVKRILPPKTAQAQAISFSTRNIDRRSAKGLSTISKNNFRANLENRAYIGNWISYSSSSLCPYRIKTQQWNIKLFWRNKGPDHTTPQEFSVHAKLKEFWKRKNHRSLWIWIEENLRQGNQIILVTTPFSKCFPFTRKRKAGVFKFPRFEERSRKAPFSWRISVDGRPNRRYKASLSYFWRAQCSVDAA